MKPFVLYTAARLGLFAITAVVVWLLFGLPELNTANLFWVMLIGLLVSSVLSIKLLARPRAEFSAAVARRADTISARVEKSRSREDHLD